MAMHDTDIDSFLKEKHNDLIKPIFNEYVQIMKREDMPDDHRLAESVYTLNRFVNNGGPPTLRITPASKNANPYAGENSHEQ